MFTLWRPRTVATTLTIISSREKSFANLANFADGHGDLARGGERENISGF